MPQRKILIPSSVSIIDPGVPDGTNRITITFYDFLERVFNNPIWNESWKHGLAQKAIWESMEKAKSAPVKKEGDTRSFVIAEEDWALLENACKFPKCIGPGGVTVPGFGYIPVVARHIIPLQMAIIEAEVYNALKSVEESKEAKAK